MKRESEMRRNLEDKKDDKQTFLNLLKTFNDKIVIKKIERYGLENHNLDEITWLNQNSQNISSFMNVSEDSLSISSNGEVNSVNIREHSNIFKSRILEHLNGYKC